jgi:hypothetical protein
MDRTHNRTSVDRERLSVLRRRSADESPDEQALGSQNPEGFVVDRRSRRIQPQSSRRRDDDRCSVLLTSPGAHDSPDGLLHLLRQPVAV